MRRAACYIYLIKSDALNIHGIQYVQYVQHVYSMYTPPGLCNIISQVKITSPGAVAQCYC